MMAWTFHDYDPDAAAGGRGSNGLRNDELLLERFRAEPKPSRHLRRAGQWTVLMGPDSAQKLGNVNWTAGEPGTYEVRAEV